MNVVVPWKMIREYIETPMSIKVRKTTAKTIFFSKEGLY